MRALRAHADPKRAASSGRFFKDAGDDRFLGVTTAQMRQVAKQFYPLPLTDVRKLISSRVHEERSLGNAILRLKYEKGDEAEQQKVFDFYVANRKQIRSWDGVDDSAPYIVGRHLLHRDKNLLYQLVRSKSIWDRRIAIVATWWFIRNGSLDHTLELSRLLIADKADLIHKACGWMLREVGKRDVKVLTAFLDQNCSSMPRTTLRYAIERFPETERQSYLHKRQISGSAKSNQETKKTI